MLIQHGGSTPLTLTQLVQYGTPERKLEQHTHPTSILWQTTQRYNFVHGLPNEAKQTWLPRNAAAHKPETPCACQIAKIDFVLQFWASNPGSPSAKDTCLRTCIDVPYNLCMHFKTLHHPVSIRSSMSSSSLPAQPMDDIGI